jgi:predicted cobalt transporter CbtA
MNTVMNTVGKRKRRRERAETVGAKMATAVASAATGNAPRIKYRLRNARATTANMMVAVGAALVFVALVDVAIVWTPLRLGTPGWEFATISRTFTNVPMTAIGWVLIAFGVVRHPDRHVFWTRGVAGAFAAMALILVAMGGVYLLSVPAVVREATPEVTDALKRALLKTGTEIVVYSTVFGLVSVILWRGVEGRVVDKIIKKRRVEAGEVADAKLEAETAELS